MQETPARSDVVFCPARTRAGNLCGRHVIDGGDFCHLHDPARAEERSRLARRAGKSKPLSESGRIRRDVLQLIEEVKAGNVDARVANAVAVLANVALGSLRLDMKIRELEDLEVRIRSLEEAAKKDQA
jgi:hypothetical protein